MGLDRGTLAKIDRRVFAELGHTAATQTVKVPLSDAMWSTCRRYCDEIGVTMGEGIAGLIDHELGTVVGEAADEGVSVFAGRAQQLLTARESQVAARENELAAVEERLRWERSTSMVSWSRAIDRRLIGFGYPADRPLAPITKLNRRPFDEVVHRDHW